MSKSSSTSRFPLAIEYYREEDGRWLADIVFTSSREGNPELYIINRDGSGLRRLTNHPAIDTSPTWSPTGTQIAFTSDRAGQPQLVAAVAEQRERVLHRLRARLETVEEDNTRLRAELADARREIAQLCGEVDFHRGESRFQRYKSAGGVSLRPILKPPFVALRFNRSILATKGGPRTNERAQVLRADGSVIAGLYCAGAAMAISVPWRCPHNAVTSITIVSCTRSDSSDIRHWRSGSFIWCLRMAALISVACRWH